ncbi:MAG: winged helix-turn-helix domain-containing protein [Thiotrichales bacterium]
MLRRRPGTGKAVATLPEDESVAFGPFLLNLGLRRLTRDGQPLVITSGEFAILKVLVEHPRQTLSRDRLMELARGREHGAYDRSIDVQISRLRRLLEDDPGKPRYIQTVWGVGYVFVPDVA